MGKKYDFDYIIIGSGPSGSSAALALAKSKKRIAIVEGDKFGGSAINSRDIPYKIGLNFSHAFSNISVFPEFGGQDLHFNFPTISAHMDHVSALAGGDNKQIFEDAGITCINGFANFIDAHTIAVGSNQFTASYFILATGSKLKVNEISGLESVNYLTPSTAIKLRRLPRAVMVVGGGASGCEIAEYFAELGTKVLLMERANHLLPREDKEAGETLADYFVDELGMMVLTGCKVVALEQDNISKRVVFIGDRQEKAVRVDCIILATGSEPVVNYGLENAGIKYKKSGIIVDKSFQTSTKHIFAIGDATSKGISSMECAEYEGAALASNLLHKTKNITNYNGFARIINTYPEIATVGLNEYDLLKRDHRAKKVTVKLEDTLSGKINGLKYGFVKLITEPNGRLIGATVMAPNASEMIGELSLAVRHRLNVLEIASTPHPSLNYSSAIKLAAKQLVQKSA
ncbi:NAD(P)/FAD-dependent oxidoreductase [Candidatus Saccharibacteria bacterium]|nr:NAD(P)/FAD-dependent oxidoreductase [Candidatus Saccharibacteria bacterium]